MSAIDDNEKEWQEIANRYLALVENLLIQVAEYKAIVSEYERITASGTAEIESLHQERDGLRDLIIKTMNSYVKEMEGYSYFGSNPGIDDDDIEEIADEIIAAMAKEQCDGN